ncbi:hypothetical protein [Geodermatophilus normandii]|uniref:Uncharacterized protein n=1 Tax=Geodermatophilus normandii TaxID=1137989 RepID=A0A6P0GLN4_9ACTN|nr:hypothetical protein [Geodermatophilus normandii]NEM08239.1 hypothetical protein [Geodermatophilus normandii]
MTEIPVRGPFDLAQSTRFLEGVAPARHPGAPDGGWLRALPAAQALAPAAEVRLHEEMAHRYGPAGRSPEALARTAEGRRPCRCWVAVLLRAACEERTARSC